MQLYGNDVTPDFTGHDTDGSLNKAYEKSIAFYPRSEWHPNATAPVPGGYDIPTSGANVRVFGPGAEKG